MRIADSNKGQAGAWEGIIILVLVVGLGAIFYYLLTAPTNVNKIAPGASQTNIEHHEFVRFGCDLVRPDGNLASMKEKK